MKIISSEEKYQNGLFHVTENVAVSPDGFEIRRAIVGHNGSAVMMAVDEKKRILLVRQYRLTVRKFIWELPAGRIDPGESALQAARRELKEETGYRARNWKKMVSFYPSPGYVEEKMTVYLATGLTAGDATPMDDERIEIAWFNLKEIEAQIEKGSLIDGKTMIGVYAWKTFYRNA